MQRTPRSLFLTALFQPTSLSMLALAAAAGLCAAWWMAPIGLALWVVVFVVAYRDPALQLGNKMAGRATLAYRFQAKFERVQKAQTSLFLARRSAPEKASRLLKPVQAAVDDLVDKTYQVCLRFANVDNYITVTRKDKDLVNEVDTLEQRLAATVDGQLKGEYDEALVSLRAQAANLERMSNLLERFEAQLTTLTSTLEGVCADAVRLQTMDESTIRSELPTMLSKIKLQAEELKGFEKQAA